MTSSGLRVYVPVLVVWCFCSTLFVTVDSLTCPAGEFVATGAAGNEFCQSCPEDTYKTDDAALASATECTPCPTDRPRTLMTGSTLESECRYGKAIDVSTWLCDCGGELTDDVGT